VIALDTYETFGLMDTWLRQKFLPALSEDIFTIIAGREDPNPAWLTTPGWSELFRKIKLGELGLQIRSGLHLGECEVTECEVRGITVHIGARVTSKAKPGEVWISSTLKEAIAGSKIRFKERGSHELKGIPGVWNLFAVES